MCIRDSCRGLPDRKAYYIARWLFNQLCCDRDLSLIHISSLEELIEQAKQLNVQMVACNMTMDIMGIKKEELIDGVEIGGVATFLNAADKSGTTLFI